MNRLSRLIQLNAKTTDLLEFRILPDGTEVDENGNPIVKGVAAVGAAGGIGYGLSRRGQSVTGNFRGVGAGYGGTAQNTVARVGSNIAAGAKSFGRQAGGLAKSGGSTIAALLAKLRGVRLESRETRIIRLNAVLDDAIELAEKKDKMSKGEIAGRVVQGGAIGYLGYSGIKSLSKATKDAGGIMKVTGMDRRVAAGKTAFDKSMERQIASGSSRRMIARAAKSGLKAARYA